MRRLLMGVIGGLIGVCQTVAASHAADPHCTDADKSTWLPPAQVQQMLKQHGFSDVGAVKTSSGNCYVVPAIDSQGRKVNLHLDPTNGAIESVEG